MLLWNGRELAASLIMILMPAATFGIVRMPDCLGIATAQAHGRRLTGNGRPAQRADVLDFVRPPIAKSERYIC